MKNKKKNKRKLNALLLFPTLLILIPPFIFLILTCVRYFKTGAFNYFTNYFYFFQVVKNIKEYIFPAILFLVFGVLIVCINKLITRKALKNHVWIVLGIVGTLIILLGERLLFLIYNNYSLSNQVMLFLLNGMNVYTITFSLEISLLVCLFMNYIDIKFLNK